jgi:diguanylate cyclase (GGDEF)-like protein
MPGGKKKKVIYAPLLGNAETEILKLVAKAMTNDEISAALGMTRGAVAYRLGKIMKKLGVRGRAGAVRKAEGCGLLPVKEYSATKGPKVKVGIVGGGRGGSAILNIFKDNPAIEVSWVADRNPKAEGIGLARKLKIPVSKDFGRFVKKGADVVINLTGSPGVREELESMMPPHAELIGGLSARLIWQLVEERRMRFVEREHMLKGHEALYNLGIVIESSDSITDTGKAILEYATRLTGVPAASLAIFDERVEDMHLVASKGFGREFKKEEHWKIRKGGLTEIILNHDGPLYIPDLKEQPHLNPLLIKEGVRTLLASALAVEQRIVGILYVNDFEKRTFTEEQTSLFSLLTIYAALAIERARTHEQIRHLSITDGLTGLYNHRYLMNQFEREMERISRHNHPLSVIMLDIDRFKNYNDRFGHLDGNKVLKSIADILLENTRLSDTVARFGGEEFCIILSEIEKHGAKIFARRLIKEIAAHPMPNRKVTVSGGVASYPEDGKTHLELLKKADSHLYRAKREGRNRVCC